MEIEKCRRDIIKSVLGFAAIAICPLLQLRLKNQDAVFSEPIWRRLRNSNNHYDDIVIVDGWMLHVGQIKRRSLENS